jgi:anti-sigma regulatory factor (Ser/Thr protein kinase)
MKYLVTIFILILTSIKIYSQENCSCKSDDTALREEFQSLANSEKESNAKKLAEELVNSKNEFCKILGYQFLSEYHYKQPDSVISFLNKEYDILKNTKCNQKLWLDYYNNLSHYHLSNNDIKNGVASITEGIFYAEALKDYEQLALFYSNLAVAFSRLDQLDKMLYYAQKLNSIIPYVSDTKSRISRLLNVATSYNTYYWNKHKPVYIDSVFNIAKDAISLSRKNNFPDGLFQGYNLMHNKPFANKNYADAINYLDSALIVIDKYKMSGDLQKKYSIYSKKVDVLTELKEYKKVLSLTDSLLTFAQKLNRSNLIFSAYNRKQLAYKQVNDYANAYRFLDKYHTMKDSINALETIETVNELEQKYNKVKNEKTIQQLSQEKQILTQSEKINSLKIKLLTIGVGLALVIIILAFYVYKQNLLKQKQNVLLTEQRLNRSRINPHFIFNSITSLQGVALKENDGKQLFTHLYNLSQLMRDTLEGSYTDIVSIEQELNFIKNYISLQKLNRQNKFELNISCAESLEKQTVYLPSMLLQPFIENAIEHGFANKEYGGIIDLRIEQQQNELKIEIQDNGIGFSNDSQETKKHISRAMQITTDRLFLLNKLYQSHARFTVKSEKNKGTTIEILLPLNLKDASINN